MDVTAMRARLMAAFPDAEIEVFDLTGGSDHWEVSVSSKAFLGLSRIQSHQKVMAAFAEELKTGEVHALSIKTQSKT